MQNAIDFTEFFNVSLYLPIAKLNSTTPKQDYLSLCLQGYYPISIFYKEDSPKYFNNLLLSIPKRIRHEVSYFYLCIAYNKEFVT